MMETNLARPTEWTEAAAVARLAATACIARVVRCRICGELAFEEARERLTDDEIAVRYSCPPCRWHQTRHFHVAGSADGTED
jgi:hypothetical protein